MTGLSVTLSCMLSSYLILPIGCNERLLSFTFMTVLTWCHIGRPIIAYQLIRLLTSKVLISLWPCTSTSIVAFLVIVDLYAVTAVNNDLDSIPSVGMLCRWQNWGEIRSEPNVRASIQRLDTAPLMVISAAFEMLLHRSHVCILLSTRCLASCREEVCLCTIRTLADLILGPSLCLTCTLLLLIFCFMQSLARCTDCLQKKHFYSLASCCFS